MNVLILGGAGFIGKHLINKFLNKKNCKVYSVDLQDTNNLNGNASYKGDIKDIDFLENCIRETKPDLIYYLVSFFSFNRNDNFKQSIKNSLIGIQNLFKILASQQKLVFIGSSAEMNRTPFDIAEAESEIIAGYHTEFSGIKFAIIQAAEYGAMIVTSAIIAVVFLGGWSGPLPEYLGWLWLLIKILVCVFVFTWVRATLPRLRIDQIMAFCWKGLLPMSLINLFAVVIETFILKGPEGQLSVADLWIMCVINTIITVCTVIVLNKLISNKVDPLRSGSRIVSQEELLLDGQGD